MFQANLREKAVKRKQTLERKQVEGECQALRNKMRFIINSSKKHQKEYDQVKTQTKHVINYRMQKDSSADLRIVRAIQQKQYLKRVRGIKVMRNRDQKRYRFMKSVDVVLRRERSQTQRGASKRSDSICRQKKRIAVLIRK